jgi:RnfABCDGE-type electron transport complex B subunit
MLTTVSVLLAAVVLGVLALAASYILGWANRVFYVAVDPKITAIQDALPGANCGGCGFVGCSEYAQALAQAGAGVDLCAPGGPACAQKLAQIMGVEVSESHPYRAVVHCVARRDQKLPERMPDYVGERTCRAANLMAGVERCTYGCLGLGDCVKACRFDAIHVIDGRAVVDYDKCTGCKACAQVCPRNIITMVPFKAERMLVVGCSNKDMGPDVKAVCKIGCIGCKACSRNSELMTIESNLPTIDYDRYDSEDAFAKALEKCPMEGLIFVGKPSKKDLAAVAAEELPDKIAADFKTTVDDTEWRG